MITCYSFIPFSSYIFKEKYLTVVHLEYVHFLKINISVLPLGSSLFLDHLFRTLLTEIFKNDTENIHEISGVSYSAE